MALVTRVKVVPPSVEHDTPEILVDCRASGVVVGDDDLVGVIRVSRSVCLRLGNVRRGFGAGDQVNVRGAKCQRRVSACLEKLREGRKGEAAPPVASPQAIMIESGPQVLLLVDAHFINGGTVKTRRKAVGRQLLCDGCAFAELAVS